MRTRIYELINSFIYSLRRASEIIFWIFIAFIASGQMWLQLIINRRMNINDLIYEFYSNVIIFLSFIFIPWLFAQIFGLMPIRFLREILFNKKNIKTTTNIIYNSKIVETEKKPRRKSEIINQNPSQADKPSELMNKLSRKSAEIAEKMYNRAGVYLFVGVIIAFAGLFFFYFMTYQSNQISKEFQERILEVLPRFGILFFIEFIALFFLRQYRSAMDEYRYFEAIKRKREENSILIHILLETKPNKDLMNFLEKFSLYSDLGKLTKGESTEILESKRIADNEVRVYEKIFETIGSIPQIKRKNSKP